MNRLLLVAMAACVGLSACSKKEEAAAPAAAPTAPAAGPVAPPSLSATTPNIGKVLQVQQAGNYTYAEVENDKGEKVWIAGGPIQVKPGEQVQWGDYMVMQNFTSKSLNRTFDQILFVNAWGPVGGNTTQMSPHGGMAQQPAAAAAAPAAEGKQGEVKSVTNAGGYTYLEVNQGNGTVWVAAPEMAVKAGDKVHWEGDMVMRNFTAKSLGRTFDQIIFASKVTVGN